MCIELPPEADTQAEQDVRLTTYAAATTKDDECSKPTDVCRMCKVQQLSADTYRVTLPADTIGPVFLSAPSVKRKVWPTLLPAHELESGELQIDVQQGTDRFGRVATGKTGTLGTQAAAPSLGGVYLHGIIEEGDCPTFLWSERVDQH